MAEFENRERRLAGINECLAKYGMSSLEEARDVCLAKGVDVEKIVKGVQPIAFENAVWAYTLGTAIALKENAPTASEAAHSPRKASICPSCPRRSAVSASARR